MRPTQAIVHFSSGVSLDTVQAGDLLFDSTPATAWSIVDAQTLSFTLPASAVVGTHTLSMANGSVKSLQATDLVAFASSFDVDPVVDLNGNTGGLNFASTWNNARRHQHHQRSGATATSDGTKPGFDDRHADHAAYGRRAVGQYQRARASRPATTAALAC